MKRVLIAMVVLCMETAAVMGQQSPSINTSGGNTKANFVISTGTSCTTLIVNLDASGNVMGTSSTSGPCSLPPGEYPFDLPVPSPNSPTLSTTPVTLVIPQVADGGGWQTTLALTNTTASAATASLSFFQETGNGDGSTQPWTPTFLDETSSTQNLSLAGGATLFLHTPGTNPSLTQGFAQATVSDGVQIYAIFSTAGGGQGTAPASKVGNHILAPFDNTNGNVTAIALANPTAASETVSVSFQTAGGAISHSSMTLPAMGQTAFLLPAQFTSTAGEHGLAEFYIANGGISLVGLQSNPADFFTTAQAYFVSGPVVIGAPDPLPCVRNPFVAACPAPIPSTSPYWVALVNNENLQIVITPGASGAYDAEVGGTYNGTAVSGSFVGGTESNSGTGSILFNFTSVGAGSSFTSGYMTLDLEETAFDAAAGEAAGNVTGSITLGQGNAGGGPLSANGDYTEVIPLPDNTAALSFTLQSRSAGSGYLTITVSNTGGVAATNVTITSITGVTSSGATFVYVPGLQNPPFAAPGGANLAPGSTAAFNLDFQATSGSAGAPFSFVITAQADNVASFTTTINVP